MNTEPTLDIIHEGGRSPLGQVIFLHGLLGDRRTTWESSPAAGCFWPAWLRDDFPDVAVCTVNYDAAATGWGGNARGLIDRAQTIAALLHGRRRDDLPTVFVCHSLGGLVAKEMLYQSVNDPGQENGWVKTMTRGVVFLATPHAGSKIADWAEASGWLGRASAVTEDLRTDSAYLERLASWYGRETPNLGIKTIAFAETKPTRVNARFFRRAFKAGVVSRESANPRVHGVKLVDIEADHIAIAKPVTRDSIVYGNVTRFIDDVLIPKGRDDLGDAASDDVEPDETEAGLTARLAEAAEEAIDFYRSEIILKLLESPAVLDALSGSASDTKGDTKARAEALATQLLAMTVDEAQDLLDKAHQRLSRSQVHAATVCFDIARLLLPAVYSPAAVRQARDQIKDQGAYIIHLDVRLELVADMIMAAVCGRELRIALPSEDGRFPEDAYLKLDLPPNIGRGGIEAYLAAWDDYLWAKFGLDGDEPDDRVRFVDDELAHRALRRRPPEIYYVVLPKDREQREALELALDRLRARYKHLLIIGLAPDTDRLSAEAGQFRTFRDMAFREGRTN